MGYLLIGLRASVPDWASIHLANFMVVASFSLRISSLRSECALPPRWRAGAVLGAFCCLVFVLADWHSEGLRVQVSMLLQTVGSAWLAWAAAVFDSKHAGRTARGER